MRQKVVHVELKEPYNGKSNYYFGSIAAIYDTLPSEVVGIRKESLWNTLHGGEYVGKEATIRQEYLIAKKTNRGKVSESPLNAAIVDVITEQTAEDLNNILNGSGSIEDKANNFADRVKKSIADINEVNNKFE